MGANPLARVATRRESDPVFLTPPLLPVFRPIRGSLGAGGLDLMKLQAIVFDFDGLIVNTERPGFISWSEIYAHLVKN